MDPAQQFNEGSDKAAAADIMDSQQAGNLLEGDQHRGTTGESQQHRMGDEIEQYTQPGRAHGQADHTGHGRQQKRQLDISIASGSGNLA